MQATAADVAWHEIFVIAAGDTGTKQSNDTDMHKPAKDQMTKSCKAWFMSKYDFYLVTKFNSGGIDSATFHGNLKALLSKTVQRRTTT